MSLPPKDREEIVVGHVQRLFEGEPMVCGRLAHVFEPADAPGGVAGAQGAVEVEVARGGGAVAAEEGAVVEEGGSWFEAAGGALEQGEAGLPGGDVDHVAGVDGVDLRDGPVALVDVELEGGKEVGEGGLGGPGGDAGEVCGVGFAGLPAQVGEGGGEVDGLLAGAAGNLEEEAGPGQLLEKNGEDLVFVAGGGGGVFLHERILEVGEGKTKSQVGARKGRNFPGQVGQSGVSPGNGRRTLSESGVMRMRSYWATGLLILLAACGGDKGDAGPHKDAAQAPSLRESSLAPIGRPLRMAEKRHFLRRTHWGVTPEDLAELDKLGLDAYLDWMLSAKAPQGIEDRAARLIVDPRWPRPEELSAYWLAWMVRTPNPFREVLAFFWHDHFAVSQVVLGERNRHYMLEHVRLLRREALGNVKKLFKAVARDPAMLVFLDGIRSTKDAPNENFAREFWELFSLGVDRGYTQKEIEEAARAFTGYKEVVEEVEAKGAKGGRRALARVVYDPALHDGGLKEIFGKKAAFDSDGVVELTFAERDVGSFLAAKLLRRFVRSDPPQALVKALGRAFVEEGWEMRPVLRRLFRSEAFYSEAAQRPLLKSPIEYAVGFVRSTGLEPPLLVLDGALEVLGERPTFPPSVKGWPRGRAWLSPQAVLERGKFVNACATARASQRDRGIGVTNLLPSRRARSVPGIVDHLIELLELSPQPAVRAEWVHFLSVSLQPKGVGIQETPDPFDWADPRHLDERLRNLVVWMAQDPSYFIK